jgi:hypothetical protein
MTFSAMTLVLRKRVRENRAMPVIVGGKKKGSAVGDFSGDLAPLGLLSIYHFRLFVRESKPSYATIPDRSLR